MSKIWQSFIKEAKREYYKIGAIKCPAFENDLVYFNKDGFNHLIRKGRKYREKNEQERRLELVPVVINTLTQRRTFSRYSITQKVKNRKESTAHFWIFNDSKRRISIVVRKLNSGNKHFFSVY
ncbi:MAG: hypothetical protein AAB917_00530 [Patescibacteria group bacterium]